MEGKIQQQQLFSPMIFSFDFQLVHHTCTSACCFYDFHSSECFFHLLVVWVVTSLLLVVFCSLLTVDEHVRYWCLFTSDFFPHFQINDTTLSLCSKRTCAKSSSQQSVYLMDIKMSSMMHRLKLSKKIVYFFSI